MKRAFAVLVVLMIFFSYSEAHGSRLYRFVG